jgi:tetratricopeptide (TPR) repeat protein
MKRALLLVLLLAFGSSAMAQTPAGMTPAEAKKADAYFHFSMAKVLDQEQAYDDSIKEYRKALEANPNDSDIYASMARTYLNARNRDEASKAAQKAVELNPNNLGAHRLLGDVYIGTIQDIQNRRQNVDPALVKQTLDRAIHEFEEITRIDPSGHEAYLMLGQLYRINDTPEKAAELYKKFLGIEPGSEDGVIALAQLSMEANHNAEAIELLTSFLKQQPQSDRVLETLGDAYSALGDTGGAADAYTRAVALNDDSDLRDKLAEALYDDNRLDEAAKLYEQILQEDQANVMTLQRLAQIYRRQMKYTESRDLLNRALRRNPTTSIRFDLALVDRDEGKFDDSVKAFESLLKDTEKSTYNPLEKRSRALFYTQIGIIRSLQTRFDDAVAAFNSVRSLSDLSERNRIDLMIADTYKEAKDIDKAESTIRAAMQDSPASRELQMAYADILSSRGRTDESIQVLQKIAGGQTPDLDLVSAIIGVYEHANRYADAQGTLDTAAKNFPDERQVHFLQGALYERQNKVPEAEQAFRKALALDKNNPSVLNYLGYMLADRDMKLDEALSMVKKAVDADPINGAFLDSLGWVYFKMNKLDLAEQYLKRAVAFAATNATMYDHLGDLYYKTDRFQEAQASWTQGLQYADEPEEAGRMRQKLEQVKSRASIR